MIRNLLIIFLLSFSLFSTYGQVLLTEDFDYPIGDLLTAHGWTAHSGAGGQPIDVTTGLTFSGYIGSGIGGAADINNTGEDVNKTFSQQTSGTVYASFLLNAGSTNFAGYFFHLGQGTIGTNFFTRVWINGTGTGIGLGNSAPSTYVTITANTTYLVVLKYELSTKVSSLFLFNSLPTLEPTTADQTFTETATITNVGSVALRQYNASQRQIVDAIRVSANWSDIFPPTSITATQLVMSGVPPTAETGVPFDITICAQDAMNNTQTDYMTPITLTQTNGTPATITPTSPQVPVGGCITYTITPTAPNEIISFSTTSGMLTPDASGDINVIQGQSACYTDNCDYSIVPVTLNIENDNWTCSAGSYTVNGFSTTSSPSELWLVSPQYLWNATNAKYTANVVETFDGSTLEVLYSTNYSGNPATATWVSIGSYTASATLNIAVPAITPGSNVVFGFKYTATGLAAGSSQYVVSNIVLKSTECANISITSCDISDITNANSSSCNDNGTPSNPVDDYFTTDISVSYSNPPATGTLGLYKDNGLTLLTTIPVGSLTPITHVFVGVQLPADGNNIQLVAKFSETPSCSFSKVLTGITNCSNTPTYIELLPAPAASVYLGEPFNVNLCFTDGAGNPITAPMYATLIVDVSPITTLSLTNTSGTGPCFTYTFNPTEVGMATVSFYDDNFDFFTSFNINVLPQPCSDIFISEVADMDTTNSNKFVEIFNAGISTIAIGGYKLNIYSNGSSTATAITIPPGTMIGAGAVFVIGTSGMGTFPSIYSLCSGNMLGSGSMTINGDDVVELTDGLNRLDIYGVIGEKPANNVSWNYTDKNAQRDPNLLCGRRNFNLNEWYISATKSAPRYTTPCSNCLMPTEGAAYGTGTINATHEWTASNGWTDYYDCNTKKLVLAIKKNGNNIGRKGDAGFLVSNFANTGATYVPSGSGNYVTNPNGWVMMNRYWNVNPLTQPTSDVSVKFYFSQNDIDAVNTEAAGHGIPVITASNAYTYKINSIGTGYNGDPATGHPGIPLATAYNNDGYWQYKSGSASTSTWALGGSASNFSAEYIVSRFSGGGAGAGSTFSGALPIEILNFSGREVSGGFLVNWTYLSDKSFSKSELQKSINGKDFVTINNKVQTNSGVIKDSYLDQDKAKGINYYRLKIVENDGAVKYTHTISNNVSSVNEFKVFPSIFEDGISISNLDGGQVSIVITGINGVNYYEGNVFLNSSEPHYIKLENCSAGVYFVKVNSAGLSMSYKIVKK
ncbi:MAG: lamin tail domain-containing protein [Saprospiraceae bacterium]|nr:lamin tail domain-containing protein [Saprospiraceae bacterium]